MHLVHERADGGRRVLASSVAFAETLREQLRGFTFREVPRDHALVFDFGDVGLRSVHMLFVREPLDVVWLRDGEVVQVRTLSPWTGVGWARADTFVELRGGEAQGVAVGDRLFVEDLDPAASLGERVVGGDGGSAPAGNPTD